MTADQFGPACPVCHSTAEVRPVGEFIAEMSSKLQGAGPQGAGPQGWAGQPQQGPPGGPGWAAEPQAGPLPGWAQQPRSGAVPGQGGGWTDDPNAARVQQLAESLRAPMMARQQQMLGVLTAVTQQHPDLSACGKDNVVFLAGNHRTLPARDLVQAMFRQQLTADQLEQMVAGLRDDGPASPGIPSMPPCPQCRSADKVRTLAEMAAGASGMLNVAATMGDAMGRPGPNTGRGYDRDNSIDDISDVIGAVGADMLRGGMRMLMRKAGQRMAQNAAQKAGSVADLAEIGRRYPDLRACTKDRVVFLAGGSHAVPISSFASAAPDQVDALVAQLR